MPQESNQSTQSPMKTPSKPSTNARSTKSGHLKKEDYLTIVNWLSHPENYDACFGGEKGTSVGRPPKLKVNGYRLMSSHLKTETGGRIDLTTKQMTERFKSYRIKYQKARILESSTGFGLSEEDCNQGVRSVGEKLELICPYYTRMDLLFGKHARVTPSHQVNAQVTSSENSSASEDHRSPSASPIEQEELIVPDPVNLQMPPLEQHFPDNTEEYLELTAEERALDESSSSDSEIGTEPKEPPNKKQKASGTSNINPKSHYKSGSAGGSASSSPVAYCKSFMEKRDSEQNQIAHERLDFERMKFNLNSRYEEKSLELEEKKLDFEREEKEKAREFEREKFEVEVIQQRIKFDNDLNRETQFRRHQLMMECVKAGKSTDEIKTLLSLML